MPTMARTSTVMWWDDGDDYNVDGLTNTTHRSSTDLMMMRKGRRFSSFSGTNNDDMVCSNNSAMVCYMLLLLMLILLATFTIWCVGLKLNQTKINQAYRLPQFFIILSLFFSCSLYNVHKYIIPSCMSHNYALYSSPSFH